MGTFKFRILSLVLVLMSVFIPVGSAFAASTFDVTITATPTFISISNDTATWVMGAILEGTTYWWSSTGNAPAEPFVDGGMKSTITNGSSVPITLSIHAHDFTGGVGWALSNTTVGSNIVMLYAGNTSTVNAAGMKNLTDTWSQTMATGFSGATLKWCMKLATGTFTDGVGKSGTVTVTAAAT